MPGSESLNEEADHLYDQYGRPLESEHWGEYAAIAPDGRTILASTPVEALVAGLEKLGGSTFIFKIGPRAVYTLR